MKYLALLALLPLTAYATGPKPPMKPPEPPKAEAKANASARSYANSEANSASESVSSANNSLTVEDRRQAPAVLAPSIAPSAPCYYSHSGGLSVPGFGASGGKAIKDEACENRENIRLAYSMGLVREADYLFCATIGKDIPDCGKKPVPETVQCDEKVERVFEKCLAK